VATESNPTRLGRAADQLRPVTLQRHVAPYAEGSCLASFGSTRVLCTASVGEGVPRATRTRTSRERAQLGGRTQEIQRLIGRSVRAMLDDFRFGEYTVRLDCDVLLADGGTRTAAITGACIATVDAFAWLVSSGRLLETPIRRRVAGVSVGVVGGVARLDLDYSEDVVAAVDMNVIMSSEGRFVEVQGTGEHGTFDRGELDALLRLATNGLATLDQLQREALAS
jgi:ribonuclease PH